MSVDTAALLLIVVAAPPLTMFVPYYAWVARGVWYRNLTSFALMVSTSGLMMLVDISLLYAVLGDDYPWRNVVRLTVYTWIAVGAWLKFCALAWESRHKRRGLRQKV